MKARVSPPFLAGAVLAIFAGGILGSAALGHWVTKASKTPALISEGAFAGSYDPGDIRGSYTFGKIEDAFGVPAAVLAEVFAVAGSGAGSEADGFAVKNLEDVYGEAAFSGLEIGTDSVRWFVALYTGLPYEPEADTGLPAGAAAFITDNEGLTGRFVDTAGAVASAAPPSAAPTSTDNDGVSEERLVKGNTTFGELRTWGVDGAAFEALVGLPAGSAGESMRDFFSAAGAEFSAFKDQLQTLIDSAQ